MFCREGQRMLALSACGETRYYPLPSSAPTARGLLLPEPDDPVHVLGLATAVLEPGHAPAAMVLRVHGDLHQRLRHSNQTGRVLPIPGDAYCSLQLLWLKSSEIVGQPGVACFCSGLQGFISRRRSAWRTTGLLTTQDRKKSLLDADDMA